MSKTTVYVVEEEMSSAADTMIGVLTGGISNAIR